MTSPSKRIGHRGIVAVATACFFLSGMAGLIYEVVWIRLLGLVFGHTVYAITTVLATYMGGLALGSVVIGRRADWMRRPLRVYGILEAAVGLYCLATPWLFRGADAAYLWTMTGSSRRRREPRRSTSSSPPRCSCPRPRSWGRRCPS